MAAAVDKGMKDPAIAARLKGMGIEPVGGTRASFVKFVDDERNRLGRVAKATGMKED
jgi:tripartite-type tricarboxylate transporter receptor subunit TctC